MNTNLRRVGLVFAMVVATGSGTAPATDWPQFGFDATHSGSNPVEHEINALNVGGLVPVYTVPLPDSSFSDTAPVYAAGIATPDGTKDLLFFTATDSLYDGFSTIGSLIAVDAATGLIVWVQTTTGSSGHASSSPAIDPGREYVYASGLDGYIHKYRISDGVETITQGPVGWPELVTLKPQYEKVAGGLTIAQTSDATYLIAVTNGYNGDGGDYQGHVTSIDLATGAQRVFNAMCSNVTDHLALGACFYALSGIWGRGGATFDASTSRIYVSTGNGLFDASGGGFEWGDSVLALPPDASSQDGLPLDSYTPENFQEIGNGDLDLGSTSLAILPAPAQSAVAHLGLQYGKDGVARLIDLDDMSGTGHPAGVGGELQVLSIPYDFYTNSQPTVWIDPRDRSTWVFIDGFKGVTAWQLGIDATGMPALVNRWTGPPFDGSLVVANGVLFGASGYLVALDARTGAPLWELIGGIGSVHWQAPIVIDGAIYMTDSEGNLTKYGRSPTHVVTPYVANFLEGNLNPPIPQTVDDGDTTMFIVTAHPPYVINSVVGCEGTLDNGTYVTAPIYADCTVVATFAINMLDLIFRDGFDGGMR